MVDISNFGHLPAPNRLGRINSSSGWTHVGEGELFNSVANGPSFREPFGIAGRPDAGEPLEFDMVADEVLFSAEMMVTDMQLALLRKLPGTSRQGRLPQKVFKVQERFAVQPINGDGGRGGNGRGAGGGRHGGGRNQPGQQALDY